MFCPLPTARYPGTLPDQPLNHATFTASADLGPMVAAAHVLAEAHPDVIVTGDHAGSFILGVGHDVVQGRAIAEASGARAGSSPSTAIVAALQFLERIAGDQVHLITGDTPHNQRLGCLGSSSI